MGPRSVKVLRADLVQDAEGSWFLDIDWIPAERILRAEISLWLGVL